MDKLPNSPADCSLAKLHCVLNQRRNNHLNLPSQSIVATISPKVEPGMHQSASCLIMSKRAAVCGRRTFGDYIVVKDFFCGIRSRQELVRAQIHMNAFSIMS